jgi:hypothetical protein
LKGAIVKGSGALKDVEPAGRFEDGHFGSFSERGTHIGKPLNANGTVSMDQKSHKSHVVDLPVTLGLTSSAVNAG